VRSQDYPNSPSSSNLYVTLPQTINLRVPYEVCLTGGNFPNVAPNVSSAIGNNIFRYYSPVSSSWKTITVPDGAYNATTYMNAIVPTLITNGDATTQGTSPQTYTYPINIIDNQSTDRLTITLNADYQLDFTNVALATLFGFTAQTFDAPATPATTTFTAANITTITQISNYFMVYTDLINGGVLVGARFPNGILQAAEGPDLGTNVELGSSVGNYVYFPLKSQQLNTFNITVYDGDDNIANLRGELSFFELTLRPIQERAPYYFS